MHVRRRAPDGSSTAFTRFIGDYLKQVEGAGELVAACADGYKDFARAIDEGRDKLYATDSLALSFKGGGNYLAPSHYGAFARELLLPFDPAEQDRQVARAQVLPARPAGLRRAQRRAVGLSPPPADDAFIFHIATRAT